GGVIAAGYDTGLDELRNLSQHADQFLVDLETRERERTGINTLKVGYNRVFGYYIEITKSNIANAPDDYIRKQTLVNAERFITPQLKEWEEKILGAEEKALKIEAQLFNGIIDALKAHGRRVQQTAGSIAVLDCLLSLGDAARELDYIRPLVAEGDGIEIEGGRHPVVEANSREFVSNDLKLGEDRVIILTWPNMAGKSTYLRQNALIVLMAQIGSFVPASRAAIGAVDRIFTRVGASDDLSRGQSTFMVEMSETANILNNATSKGFVILDEIGRGTSTFDGLSIAWAVVEHILDKIGAKTLFATHYHELTELSLTKERVKNYNMAVKEWDDRIIFLRKVLPGGSSRSYGIQVARLAGIPTEVISRSKEILRNLETGELNEAGMPKLAARDGRSFDTGQLSLLAGDRDPVHDELKSIDLDRMTPLEALTALHKMKELLKN
ncbi:MAG: DNA mismatch repair protein MutS, partial [Deltaproteobacteria bacterium]|nr:DNA mismatch repair protein MutS [Deltaproteobacteria bacterium]